jgi:hypothetical protein
MEITGNTTTIVINVVYNVSIYVISQTITFYTIAWEFKKDKGLTTLANDLQRPHHSNTTVGYSMS